MANLTTSNITRPYNLSHSYIGDPKSEAEAKAKKAKTEIEPLTFTTARCFEGDLKSEAETKAKKARIEIVPIEGRGCCLSMKKVEKHPDLFRLCMLSFYLFEASSKLQKCHITGGALSTIEEHHNKRRQLTEAEKTDPKIYEHHFYARVTKELEVPQAKYNKETVLHYSRIFQRHTVDNLGNVFLGNDKRRLFSITSLIEIVRKAIFYQLTVPPALHTGIPLQTSDFDVIYVQGPTRFHIIPIHLRNELQKGGTCLVYTNLELLSGKVYVIKEMNTAEVHVNDGETQDECNALMKELADDEMMRLDSVDKRCHQHQMVPVFQKPHYANVRIKSQNGGPDTILSVSHFYRSETLWEWMKTHPSYAERLNFVRFIFQTYDVMKTIKLVHRDLKPENIFLEKGRDKVSKFAVSDLAASVLVDNDKKLIEWLKNIPYVTYSATPAYGCSRSYAKLEVLKTQLDEENAKVEGENAKAEEENAVDPKVANEIRQHLSSLDLRGIALISFIALHRIDQPDADAFSLLDQAHNWKIKSDSLFKRALLEDNGYPKDFIDTLAEYCDHSPAKRPLTTDKMLEALKKVDVSKLGKKKK